MLSRLLSMYNIGYYQKIDLFKRRLRAIWLRGFLRNGGNIRYVGKIGMIKGLGYISVGNGTCMGDYVYLTAWRVDSDPELNIGENCQFGAFNHITCVNKITIGNNCLTGKWITITDNSHGYVTIEDLSCSPLERKIISKGPVFIGNNVWLGDKVTILPNVKIGDGVIVAANSVVTHDIPNYCVVAGNPAKVIKQLNIE